MGEVGGTAEHRDFKPHVSTGLLVATPCFRALKVDDQGIEFHSVNIQPGGKFEIIGEAHGAINEGLQFGLGESGEFGHFPVPVG